MLSESEKLAMKEEKKPYQTPKLIKHGTVEQITGSDECDDAGISGCVAS